MAEWKKVKIGDALKEVSREEKLNPNTKYRLLGVRWYGKGVFQREEKLGKEIKATKLYRAKKGDFIYNRLFAWKSSFAIVPDEFDGCLVSNEFPLFICNESKFLADFLLSYILLPQNIETVNRVSGGMSSVSRKRFKEIDFLNLEIPQYDISFQKSICQKLKKICEIAASQDLESDTQLSLLNKLRQAVLQEAIEGKLTAEWRKQNPKLISGENHASKLLEKIKAEKERLIKEGKIKKDKPLAPIAEAEKPFDLPEGWAWCRLGEIVQSMTNGLYKPELFYKETGVACLRMYNIQEGKISFHNLKRMILTEEEIKTYSLLEGDLLLNRVNSVELLGKAAYINKYNEPLVYESKNIRVRFVSKEIIPKYINVVFLTEIIKNQILKNYKKVTGQASINQGQLSCFQIPFLPFAEQQAIVERVDKLMAMIDALEKQVSERKDQAETLMQSVLQEVFAGEEINYG